MEVNNSFSKGLRDGIPIAMGYLGVAFAFGMLATEKGMPALASLIISMTNLTAAGQFAGLGIIVSGGAYIEMALSQIIINLRYSLMSISVSQKLSADMGFLSRLAVAFGITDEIFAVTVSNKGEVGKKYMFGLIALPYGGWCLGTLIGAIASNLLPPSVRSALGISLYAMFIAIIFPVAKKSKAVLGVVLTSAAISCLFTYVPVLNSISSGFVIIISGVAAAALFAIIAPHSQEVQE